MFKELKFDYSCTFLSQFATFTGGWVGGLNENKANLSQAKLKLSWD